MKLINQTVLATNLFVSPVSREDERKRLGLAVAKATFEVARGGRVRLTDADPVPVLESEIATDLGDLPRDVLPRVPGRFDVVLLAAACADGGRPVPEQIVELTVGPHRRALVVTGDREWLGSGTNAHVSEARPFVRMPLTWERTHGGKAEVWIDPHTVVPVAHPHNPHGIGFDALGWANALGRTWGCPDGFPRLDGRRALPNIEAPHSRMRCWGDDPDPVCWATVPLDVGLHVRRAAAELTSRGAPPFGPSMPSELSRPSSFAHPDWRISLPTPGALVRLQGCRPDGEWAFALPTAPALFDYEIGARRGTLCAEPVQLLLLPDESRFTLTYHAWFRFVAVESESRSLRVRLAN